MARRAAPVDRDYAAEMLAIVKAETVGAYRAPDVAAEIVAKLRATDPDLLIGFFGLERTMVSGLRDYINHLNRARREGNRRKAREAQREETQARFAEAVRTGDVSQLRATPGTDFLGERFVVNEDGLQLPFGQTGKPERLFIIEDYAGRVKWNGLHLAYHGAVQRKCGNRITGQVFSEDKLASLYRSIVGEAA